MKTAKPLGVISRTEISLFCSPEENRFFMAGTSLYSVIYKIIHHEYKELEYPFIKKLREVFPRDKGLGLVIKKNSIAYTFEVALASEDDCILALSTPVFFSHAGNTYEVHAIKAIPPTHQLYRIQLSNITLLKYDDLKIGLKKTFSVYGTILDIVVYEDDITGS